MMRSLWTAATGMQAQQQNMDVISHNLSNVNTTGYKGQRAEFKDLLYANMQQNTSTPLQVGHGVKTSATTRDFKEGSLTETRNSLDLAIEGDGFFSIRMPNGEIKYTRDGSFKLSVEGNNSYLVTSEGYYVIDETGNRIPIPQGAKEINIDELGNISIENELDQTQEIARLGLVSFINPQGLSADGSNLYTQTQASGAARPIAANNMDGRVMQGYLEASNVQVVDEMIKMITAQRAYEISSKAITTSDEMLQLANNLKR